MTSGSSFCSLAAAANHLVIGRGGFFVNEETRRSTDGRRLSPGRQTHPVSDRGCESLSSLYLHRLPLPPRGTTTNLYSVTRRSRRKTECVLLRAARYKSRLSSFPPRRAKFTVLFRALIRYVEESRLFLPSPGQSTGELYPALPRPLSNLALAINERDDERIMTYANNYNERMIAPAIPPNRSFPHHSNFYHSYHE